MATKILLVNVRNQRFLFKNTGEIFIDDRFSGMGRLVTPIDQICLRKPAFFTLEHKKYSTGQLKGCMIDD